MKPEQILPTVLITIDLFATIVYLYYGDWKRSLYWIFAAGLTWTVTF